MVVVGGAGAGGSRHNQASETNRLIQDIVAHAKKDKAYESIQPQLASIVHKVLSSYPDFTATFTTMVRSPRSPHTCVWCRVVGRVVYVRWR